MRGIVSNKISLGRLLWSCLAIVVALPLFGQNPDKITNTDTTTTKKQLEFIYGLDNRRTNIQGQFTLIYGAYLGIGINERLRLKIGLSGTPFEVGKTEISDGVIQRNRFYFLTLGEELDVFHYKKFILTTYFQIGYGFNDYRQLTVENENTLNFGRQQIVPLEIGMHGSYYFYPWLALKLGGGWRFVFPKEANYLSGYYLKLGLGFSTTKFLSAYRNWKLERD